MKFLKLLAYFLLIYFYLGINYSFGAINMNITPIKYELEANPGEIITRQAKLTNNSNESFHIITGKSDFIASGDDGRPQFIRRSEEVLSQELSNWITIDTNEFNINPGETKIINFTINIPENSTPGGHYGAVFFKNKNSENSSGAQVGINIDYGILILLKIRGDIITDINIGDPIIGGYHSGYVKHMDVCNETGGDQSGDYYDGKCLKNEIIENKEDENKQSSDENKQSSGEETLKKDDCIIDLTSSEYDGKCIDDSEKIISEITGNITNIDFLQDFNEKDNVIDIKVPIENKGNTHVKPKGKITLIDENGKIIKGVGKEIVTNKKGAIIGEKIVDYLPFNDIGGNILPNTKRIYDASFKGFPYKTYDENGDIKVKYWTPGEYYTKKGIGDKYFLMPWERMCIKRKKKTITAKFDIKYLDENEEEITYNSAKDFEIEYKQKEIELNPYFFLILGVFFLIIFLLFILFRKKKKICINKECAKKINKDMKICPYCGTKQDNSKIKKIALITKNKLKTKDLDLPEKIKKILIKNKLKFADELSNKNKSDLLNIKGIGKVALKEIQKALKKEKLKIKK